ncbi:cobalamin biosynthesis protein D [Thermoplasma volcanium GSS1]|uniref:Cobalt-precorrin-5B C(1)-methyltransferase n=1 Tax=Thermoplasma volcanium (strain ATCC 51530 / DSM 4299 / JCM 9571 / NBRC 15438 / GSS1) TaxID=273116 RepID=CBID_THEVO|nr:cobalt-precorrin-5B (C(1))-methyltransferase CbiD [Thermoplasma volcanium]Q97A63.1 RecName: Full=Cobalt-precorrin-5B C(1)-methyltransferase; AltName: Full=Cobalt-precorrin-6A synthase [Thermoplasma volcanium GSS1]BAB60089.1 cobalamin biosynthesis protein D [Thermoplasma volcanium GSS1]
MMYASDGSGVNPFQQYGITTGLTAAAAAKACTLTVLKGVQNRVVVPTPIGIRIEVKVVESVRIDESSGYASAEKFSGDNPDQLNGITIRCHCKVVKKQENGRSKITISGNAGIGVVEKDGLGIRPGEKAISQGARKMIEDAVREAAGGYDVELSISVPNGEEFAKLTMNEKVGVFGGISVLGTTGIEEPVSTEEYELHLKYIVAAGRCVSKIIVLCPGNTALKFAKKYFALPDKAFVLIGDKVGAAVSASIESAYDHVVIFGLPGKLVKIAAGIYNTHSKVADGRMETLAAVAAMYGISKGAVKRIMESSNTGEAISIIEQEGIVAEVLNTIASRISNRLKADFSRSVGFSVVIIDHDGKIIGSHLDGHIKEVLKYGK